MSTIDSENNGKSASEKRALVAAVLLAKSTGMRLLSRNTGTYAEACDLGHVSKPSNKHDHLHKEYKYRNSAFRWVSKPDGFGTQPGEIRQPFQFPFLPEAARVWPEW